MMLLGDKINLLMTNANLTRKEFGQICGVSGDTVGEWIRNKSKPNKQAFDKIVSTFNIDVDRLMDDSFPLEYEKENVELKYLNLGDNNLNNILNELNEVIMNDYNLRFDDRLVDKQIRKIIADSISIGIGIARQNIGDESK